MINSPTLRILFICSAAAMNATLAAQPQGELAGSNSVPSIGLEKKLDSKAHDLVIAMLAHDQTVATLEWDQVVTTTPGKDNQARYESHQLLDGDRWAIKFKTHFLSETPPDTFEGETVFDGHQITARNDSNKTVLIRGYQGDRRTAIDATQWLGRGLDRMGKMRLGDYLLASPDLHVDHYSERGLPVVVASAHVGVLLASLEVEIDSEHGFAPRVIVERDRALRVPYERFEVEEFVKIGQVWLPCKGILETRVFRTSEEEESRFIAALSKFGVTRTSDMEDPDVIQKFAGVLRQAFGKDEAPSVPMVLPLHMKAQFLHVNEPITASRFLLETPREYLGLNEFTNSAKPQNSDEWHQQ